jgi:hypothetical protein
MVRFAKEFALTPPRAGAFELTRRVPLTKIGSRALTIFDSRAHRRSPWNQLSEFPESN